VASGLPPFFVWALRGFGGILSARFSASSRRFSSSAFCLRVVMFVPKETILWAFQDYPAEAAIIGRLLAGYGDLEFTLLTCVVAVSRDVNTSIRTLFRVRGEKQRIQIADAIIRHAYKKAGLYEPYCEGIGAMEFCRQIRNQYAHCHWISYKKQQTGLFFTDLEDVAKQNSDDPTVQELHVDVPLLDSQEAYFSYTMSCLVFLNLEYKRLTGQSPTHTLSMPKKRPRPKLHNPPEEHPPPTLKEVRETPPESQEEGS
jgi:hypothetical protein